MRLTESEIEIIKSVVQGFDPNAEVRLFGSRVDDRKRGEDIDLIILSEKIGLDEKLEMKLRLYERLGERKMDILIYRHGNEFHRMALRESVAL